MRPGAAGEGGLENEDLSLGNAVRVVRKRKRIILATALVCGLIAVLATLVLRSHYKSVAVIEVEQDQENPLQSSLGAVAATGGAPDDPKTQVQTEVSVLQSDDLALQTIEQTHFEAHTNKDRPSEEKNLPLAQTPKTRVALLGEFSRHLTVTPIEGTRLVQVGYTDTDPKFAALTTTTLINQYIRQRMLRRNSSTSQATDWIGAQIADVGKKLEASQQALMDYQRKSGLLSLPAAGGATGVGATAGTGVRSPAVDSLVQLNQSLVAAQTDRIAKEAIYRVVVSGDQDALASVAGSQLSNNEVKDPTQAAMYTGLINLRQQQGALDLQLSTAKQNYGAKNPHLIELQKQSDELKRQIRDEVKAIIDRASLDYRTAVKNEAGLREAYNNALNKTGDASASQVHLTSLQQEADSDRALYQDLYTKLEQSRLAVGTQASNIAIISKALPPADPSYPRPFLYPLIGVLAGLLLGLLAAFIVEGADNSIALPSEIERLTGLPVLASIPLSGNGAGGQPGGWLKSEPQGLAAEAFRDLRTNLVALKGDSAAKTLLVSSPLPSEGRSSTVYNLAVSFAMTGQNVLIIESDLRKPTLDQYAGSAKGKGLSAWLTSSESVQGLIVPDAGVPGLSIITAGSAVTNPAELLGSARFDELLARCREAYDLILLDSPASLIVTDAAVLSRKVDGVILLAKSGSTSRLALERAVQQFDRNRVPLLGVALNAVNTSSSEFYYAHGFAGSRGKGQYGYEKV